NHYNDLKRNREESHISYLYHLRLVYVCIYMYICIYVYVYMYIYMYICIYVYMYVYICIYMNICIYVYMYVYICICMYMFLYIYIHIYTNIHKYIYIGVDIADHALEAGYYRIVEHVKKERDNHKFNKLICADLSKQNILTDTLSYIPIVSNINNELIHPSTGN